MTMFTVERAGRFWQVYRWLSDATRAPLILARTYRQALYMIGRHRQ